MWGAISLIISLIIQAIKLWLEYKKKHPGLAAACRAGIEKARKDKDFTLLEQIIEKLKQGDC